MQPLADILERAEPELMVQAIEALAQMHATEATDYPFRACPVRRERPQGPRPGGEEAILQLLGQVPSKAQAAKQLYDLALSYLAGTHQMRIDMDGRLTMCSWDPATKVNARLAICRRMMPRGQWPLAWPARPGRWHQIIRKCRSWP